MILDQAKPVILQGHRALGSNHTNTISLVSLMNQEIQVVQVAVATVTRSSPLGLTTILGRAEKLNYLFLC